MQYDHIPERLRATGRFCVWGYRNVDGRQAKVPYNPHGGYAKSNDPSTFATFAEAVAAQEEDPEQFYGIGLGLFGNLVGIDIDHCRGEGGQLSSLAQDIVERLGSYTEYSPSGEGVHIYCCADKLPYDANRYYLKNKEIGLEVYAAGFTSRYLTMTGNALVDEDVNERSAEIAELLEKYMRRSTPQLPSSTERSPVKSSVPTEDADAAALDDAELIERAFKAKNGEKFRRLWEGDTTDYCGADGEPDDSAADQALCNELAYWTQKNAARMDRLFRQSGLMRDKWDEKRGALTYGQMTTQKAIADCREVYNPHYRTLGSDGERRALEFLRRVDVAHNPRYRRDDLGAGYLLADFLRSFARPVPERKGWKVYDGRRWIKDVGGKTVEAAAKDLCRAIGVYASLDLTDEDMQTYLKWATRWATASNRRIYVQEATSVYPVSESDFDRDPWLLNLNNGTLDLHTMELKEHNPDDLLTQLSPVDYNPSAACPRWDRFIAEIMEPAETEADGQEREKVQADKAAFLQKYLGYCLCGSTAAEAFAVLYGPTSRNGKSVCVETVQAILGSYAKTVNADTLMLSKSRDGSGPSEDIARLAGVRMASVGEIQQGSKLDASRVKSLTGGDTINARFLGENSFEFTPQFKLLLHSNHLPICSDMSVFDSGRALVIPFSRHFSPNEQDRNLKREFRKPENQSAILNWLIQGLTEYLKDGLTPPPAVVNATRDYRKDGDRTSRFLEEAMLQDGAEVERTALVYAAYRLWCRENGQFAESSRNFLRSLDRAGVQVERKRPKVGEEKTTVLVGYRLLDEYLQKVQWA